MTDYFYVPLTKKTVIDFAKGISWLLSEARSAGSGWLAVHTLRNLETVSRYEGMSGLARLLKPPHEVRINGIPLKLITESKKALLLAFPVQRRGA